MVPSPLDSSGRWTRRVFDPALAGVVPLYGVVGGTDVSGIPKIYIENAIVTSKKLIRTSLNKVKGIDCIHALITDTQTNALTDNDSALIQTWGYCSLLHLARNILVFLL